MEPLFLKPVFKEMIWGGNKLREYGYDIPGDDTGECWAISAHPNGDCEIKNGEYAGKTLSWLWNEHRELFGNAEGDRYPLLIKIIDAKDDLSIQVHPDDAYAAEHENGSFGKTECWYIIDCEPGTKIVIGHNAKDHEEMADMINGGRWKEFIREIPVHKGDFFQIEPGTLHAIKGGTQILETQQNSDITYRVYDYDRLQNGKPSELHIKQSIDVIKAPFSAQDDGISIDETDDFSLATLIKCDKYVVQKLELKNSRFSFDMNFQFLNVSVLEGEGKLNDCRIKKGDHFIIPSGFGKTTFSGELQLIMSYVPKVFVNRYKVCNRVFEARTMIPIKLDASFLCSDENEPTDYIISFGLTELDTVYRRYKDYKVKNNLSYVDSSVFYRYYLGVHMENMLAKDGFFPLHSSCVAVDGEAYLFMAASGTGKSTHAGLWKEYFGDRAVIQNDDMPLVSVREGVPTVYGFPYMGSKNIGVNVSYQIKALCFLDRAVENSIERVTEPEEMRQLLVSNGYRFGDLNERPLLKKTLSEMFLNVGFYKIHVNMELDAVKTVYEGINRDNDQE